VKLARFMRGNLIIGYEEAANFWIRPNKVFLRLAELPVLFCST
jgi:hypothetical protein